LQHPDWVDRTVGRHANVVFVWPASGLNTNALWQNEFFNRSIGRVYGLGSSSPGGLPETRLAQRRDGTLSADGRPVHAPYALADEKSLLAGNVIARDPRIGAVLLRTDGTLSIAYRVSGLYPNDFWSGRRLTYARFHCVGGTLTATLGSDGSLFRKRQTVSARSGRNFRAVTFAPTATAELSLPLQRSADGTCRVAFTVSRTAVPALIEPGNRDARILGARFLEFRYHQP